MKTTFTEDEIKQMMRDHNEIEQSLGQALGYYPWFKDDRKNFPDADETWGVCIGDHVPVTIALEAAKVLASPFTFLQWELIRMDKDFLVFRCLHCKEKGKFHKLTISRKHRDFEETRAGIVKAVAPYSGECQK